MAEDSVQAVIIVLSRELATQRLTTGLLPNQMSVRVALRWYDKVMIENWQAISLAIAGWNASRIYDAGCSWWSKVYNKTSVSMRRYDSDMVLEHKIAEA